MKYTTAEIMKLVQEAVSAQLLNCSNDTEAIFVVETEREIFGRLLEREED